ncbi:hypothetical protein A9Y58_00065 [Streptococcus parauberis]|nr:hypothetical protein ASN87_01703 [Streptococcus parauberis]PCH14566.1 hypothetical protein A9Y58_00065 [Streptococcus parauberis]
MTLEMKGIVLLNLFIISILVYRYCLEGEGIIYYFLGLFYTWILGIAVVYLFYI